MLCECATNSRILIQRVTHRVRLSPAVTIVLKTGQVRSCLCYCGSHSIINMHGKKISFLWYLIIPNDPFTVVIVCKTCLRTDRYNSYIYQYSRNLIKREIIKLVSITILVTVGVMSNIVLWFAVLTLFTVFKLWISQALHDYLSNKSII